MKVKGNFDKNNIVKTRNAKTGSNNVEGKSRVFK